MELWAQAHIWGTGVTVGMDGVEAFSGRIRAVCESGVCLCVSVCVEAW